MKATQADCAGCRDDFYNGSNELGVKVCWHLKDARMEKRLLIHVDAIPPYKAKPKTIPHCYGPPRTVNVAPDHIDAAGYWK